MKKLSFVFLAVVALSAAGKSASGGRSVQEGDWIASGGIGFTINPTTFLIAPQLEYAFTPNLYFGPLMQLGIASGVLFAASGSVRYVIGNNPHLKPNVIGGLGVAVASSFFGSAVGVNIHIGMGFDYQINSTISVGTELIGNFAPPMQTFYFSWPLVTGRFLL